MSFFRWGLAFFSRLFKTLSSLVHSRTASAVVSAVMAAGMALLIGISLPVPAGWPALIRDAAVASGYEDTGAPNLVSSIYLGYRAVDTLGETIVLLLAVTGTVFFLKGGEKPTPKDGPPEDRP